MTRKARNLSLHVLPDVLQPGLALVFCGTAAGKRSAAERAYYAHPGNLFWRALHEAGITARLLAPAEFPLLPQFGIGLTDLAKRHSGNDDELPPGAFDVPALRAKMERYAPRVIAFTSKNAARAALGHAVSYGLQDECIGTTSVFVLPSPSGQARGHWDIEPWRALAALVSLSPPEKGME
ncbi:mismatch-specific DNA-glycosylase [Rhodanobacter hydrolyticus]|uniref:Mismatch-specific DNA-glycosylase n=1 Tax=Rhodanobacter hydrolyticus TaxID=2250595 RepID=A0ABW8JBM4_9GAMM